MTVTPGMELIRPTSAKAWDLRASWAAGWRVSVTLEAPPCDRPRIEGIVSAVSATGARARIRGLWFPLDYVLAVHKPSRLGDSTARTTWGGHPRRIVLQAEELPLEHEGSTR